ncbi:hypothetical protein ALP39_200344 [Pseudomonas marginalis pv. marginalis]|nr:hypothetical protein ALP39_200344 [Pseudomonas marginalis pv. marginalis]
MPNHTSLTAFNYRYALTYLAAFCVSGLTAPVAAAYSASEQANLNVILRQLNTLEDTAYRNAQLIEEPGKRYSFDYQRLTDDIARIRKGLKDYLSPTRAQPRDPVDLSGNYTTEGRQP